MEDEEGCFFIPEFEGQDELLISDESLPVDPAEFDEHSATLLSGDEESINKSLTYFSQLLSCKFTNFSANGTELKQIYNYHSPRSTS